MSFTVSLIPSGHAFRVEPGQHILDAGLAQGLGLPYSCKTGICGTCKGHLAAGKIEHGEVSDHALTAADRSAGKVLLCRASALSDCAIQLREVDNTVRPEIFPCRVSGLERLRDDVMRMRVRVPMNRKLRLLPGQYVEFLLKDSQRRSYSVATPPMPDGLDEVEFHIRHVEGGLFTDALFSTVKERDMLRFEGPLGSFFLREDSRKPVVLLATGTGIAPILAMVEHVLSKHRDGTPTRPMSLYWGGRAIEDLYLLEGAQRWAQAGRLRLVPVLSRAHAEWAGRRGYVQDAVIADVPDLSGHEVYACGSPAMVEGARNAFRGRAQLPEESFFADAFYTAKDRAEMEHA